MSAFDSAYLPPGAPGRDLSDAECAELDGLLGQAPEPFEPMGVVMLDGFLCGVLVQPVQIEPGEWLPHVFDAEGRDLPEDARGAWHERAVALTLLRYRALNRALLDDGAFEPLVADDGEDDENDATGAEPPAPAPAPAPEADAAPAIPAASRPLVDWVAGFHFAAGLYPDLEELDDDLLNLALARIYRHLPTDDADQLAVQAALDAELPLASVDEAIDDLVAAVADIADFTRDLRFQVDTVRRDVPKVGRNDPCPCGSGRKYKRCHGDGAAVA